MPRARTAPSAIWKAAPASISAVKVPGKPFEEGGDPMFSIKPLHEKVVVERMDAETKSSGGILIPDTAKEKPMRGTVIAVGPGRVLESGEVKPLDVKKGDT